MPPLACLDTNCPLDCSFVDETAPLPDRGSKGWSAGKSTSLYKIDGWGAPYFFVNGEGDMAVRPRGNDTKRSEEIDIMKAVQMAVESRMLGEFGLPSPLIVRFPDILKNRLEKLQFAFDKGIRAENYHGRFQGVFPVKCNQDRFVVENIVDFGKPYDFGLEAGSKPELLLAMSSLCKGSPDALLVCNGYKDADYVCLALRARQLRLNSIIVLEQAEELDVVVKMSQLLRIEPVIGLRAKLNTKHAGHFGETSGEKGKFGLSCREIVEIVQELRRFGMLGCLQMLHFHIGSQVPSLAILNDGVSEAAHIFCELALMGSNMKFLDIGGGLGIDYDGSNSAQSDMSVGYSIDDYAGEVVHAVKTACAMKSVKEPTLCSESGRALVSHHSVLVFDVLSVEEKGGRMARDMGVPLEVDGLPEEKGILHRNLIGYARARDYERSLECAKHLKEDCSDLFKQGRLSLTQLASINSIYEVLSTSVEERRHEKKMSGPISSSFSMKPFDSFSYNSQEEVGESGHNAIYHINLSIFKSMPDTWAIGQLFPIVPLQRLDDEPTVRAVLSDLTCDSDGKVTNFIGVDSRGKRMNFLPVHALEEGKPYYMGMFLGGAYQEALGSMHNLFGAPPVVHVSLNKTTLEPNATFSITKTSAGHTAADVLRCMHHDPDSMLDNLKLRIRKSLHHDGCLLLEDEEAAAMAAFHTVACSFESSTYLSTSNPDSSVVRKLFHAKPAGMGSVLFGRACCCP